MERKPIIFQTRWPQIDSHLLLQENTWGTAVPGSQAGTQLSDLATRTNREESSQAEGRAYVMQNLGGSSTARCWGSDRQCLWLLARSGVRLSPKETPEPDREVRVGLMLPSSGHNCHLFKCKQTRGEEASVSVVTHCGRQSTNRIARCGVCERRGGQLASIMEQASRQRAREPT